MTGDGWDAEWGREKCQHDENYRHHCEPKSVIQKFAKDLQLLEEIYLFESVHDRLADADGAFLKELCCCRKAFAKDYIDTLLKDNHHRLHDDNKKLHALFECPDFIDIIDLLVDGCSQTSFPLFDYGALQDAPVPCHHHRARCRFHAQKRENEPPAALGLAYFREERSFQSSTVFAVELCYYALLAATGRVFMPQGGKKHVV